MDVPFTITYNDDKKPQKQPKTHKSKKNVMGQTLPVFSPKKRRTETNLIKKSQI